jgi:hypothetical protein
MPEFVSKRGIGELAGTLLPQLGAPPAYGG